MYVQRITKAVSLASDLRFPWSAQRLARSGWQPEGQGFESPWVHDCDVSGSFTRVPGHRSSTALSVRSSSQSISSSAKVPSSVSPRVADPVGPLEVGEHQDVKQLGVGSGAEGLQALLEAALQFVGSHDGRLRRGTVGPRVDVACHTHSRILAASRVLLLDEVTD